MVESLTSETQTMEANSQKELSCKKLMTFKGRERSHKDCKPGIYAGTPEYSRDGWKVRAAVQS